MLSRQLWQAITSPPTSHPLFWRTVLRAGATQFPPVKSRLSMWMDRAFVLYITSIIALGVLVNVLVPDWRALLLQLFILLLLLPFLGVILFFLSNTILNGTLHGIIWSLSMSAIIAEEYERGRHQLLYVSPAGALGATWAIATGFLYRHAAFHQFLNRRMMIVRIAYLSSGLLILALLPDMDGNIDILAGLASAILVYYIDTIHSPLTGILLGMLIPTYTGNRLDTRLWVVSMFLFVQITTYTLTLVTALLVVPTMLIGLEAGGQTISLGSLLISLLVFYLIREGIISGLWYLLMHRLNADSNELYALPPRAVQRFMPGGRT